VSALIFSLSAAALFAVGLYGVLTRCELIHRLLAVNIMASAVFLFLIIVSTRGTDDPDPVPQALVLTGIVISVALTAFALSLIRHLRVGTHRETLEQDDVE